MFIRKISILASIALCCVLHAFGQNDNKFNEVVFNSLPELCVSKGQGVSAPFAGVVGGATIVAGGCNFPDTPAAEGGQKQYYGTVYRLSADGWTKDSLQIPPTAYGVSVQVPDGLVCIGGLTPDSLSPAVATVHLITFKDGQLVATELPALPVAIHSAAGGFDGTHIYVAGGENNVAYRMAYPAATGWE
jgi:sialate O-acetylesterase